MKWSETLPRVKKQVDSLRKENEDFKNFHVPKDSETMPNRPASEYVTDEENLSVEPIWPPKKA